MYNDENDPINSNPEEEDVDNSPDVEESGNEQEESSNQNTRQSNTSKTADISKRLKDIKRSKEVMSKMKSIKSMSFIAKFILPILPYILIVLVIIIILVGLLMFLLTMPGMVIQKMNELAEGFMAAISNMIYGKETTMTSDESIISVADYLESMGYDLKSYGFVTEPVDNAVSSDFEGNVEDAYIDANGIGRTKDGITNIKSDVLKTYLISDNYVYCVRNFNKNFATATSSWKNFISGALNVITRGFLGDTINWGSGLISIYEEQGQGFLFWKKDKIGIAGDSYENHFLDGESISVDPEAKTLTISKSTGFLGLGKTKNFIYNLEGWTGRYGIPLEFLLSVHFTSMSPDLALDLATSFDTNVVILLHETNTTIESAYKDSNGSMLTYEQLDSIAGWFLGKSDIAKIFAQTGIQSPENCENLAKEDVGRSCSELAIAGELSSACSECTDFVDSIKSDLSNVKADVTTYIPYISKVTDHWFRDVYFVAPLETEIITNDEDYEAETGERWTEYETKTITNEDGEEEIVYQLYYLDDNGNLGEKYDGTSEQAKEEGIKVAKKALGKTIEEIAAEGTIQAGGWFEPNYWAAYEYKETEGSWELYEGAEGEDAVDINNPGQIYYRERIKSNISQIQDGQRGPTNEKIKQIFSTNKYYIYDGTPERAELIKEDQEKTDRSKDNKEDDERNPDLIGSFSVTRDSLTAFNMLENMNTLDSDAIYRDFKELIVELDYFDKEDLTNIPTEVFEWPIPECGSGGWPIRRFEKVEDVFGTLINSKVDLNNLKKKNEVLIEIVKTGEGDVGDQTQVEDGTAEEVENEATANSESLELAKEKSIVKEKNGQDNIIEENLINPIAGLETLYASGGGGSGSGYQASTFIETAKNVWEHVVNGNYTYDNSYGKAVPVPEPHIDCSAYVSWVLYEYGYDDFEGGQVSTSVFMSTDWNAKYGWEVIEVSAGEDCSSKLQAGDILVREDEKTHHVQIIKEIDPSGNIIVYDCGSTSNWSQENLEGMIYNSFAKTNSAPGKIIRIEDANNGAEFEGYEPYQDVVTPITGEIIEAGTTTIDNIETGVEEEVGFIKIRALAEEDVEAYFNSEAEELEGYKYYYEEYERAGVTDYILYIEGFDLRIVNESLQLTNDLAIIDENTGEIRNSYTENNYDDVYSQSAREILEEKEDKRVKASSVVQAGGKIFVKEGTVLGKTYTDGADAGANSEEESTESEPLPDDAKERPGIALIPEDQKTMTTEDGEVIDMPNGNYIRLILRTNELGGENGQDKDSIVENVEDYLEIDNEKQEENDWELFFWLPFESGGTDQDGCGPESQGTCSSGETAVGIIQWTVLTSKNMNNIASQFIPGCLEEDPVLCAPLAAYQSWSASDFWNDYCGSKQFQATLSSICDTDRDGFLHCQMEVAKKQYLDPILEEYPWLEERPSCVQGAVMHLKVWGADYSWISSYQSSSDEDIILKVRNTIANTSSTAGEATGDESSGRAYNEPQIALEILSGAMSADDVEQWVRTKDVSYLSFDWKN